MAEKKSVWDMIDLEALQKQQDIWGKAMEFSFVTVDYKGIPVTKYSNFSPHCLLGRTTRGFANLCEQCDAHGGLHAAITGEPYIYRCHAGLVDFSIPLIIDGSFVGAVLGGQVRLPPEEECLVERILPQEGKYQQLEELYGQTDFVTYDKIQATVQVIQDVIKNLLHQQIPTADLALLEETTRALEAEQKLRAELEYKLKQSAATSIRRQESFLYFFFVMNIISRLAYEENASRTEEVVYDFSAMMRYTADSKRTISSLEEELDYVSALLRIHSAWHEGKLDFRIHIQEGHKGVLCPYMILQPLVEELLSSMDYATEAGCVLDISGHAQASDLVLTLSVSGGTSGMTVRSPAHHTPISTEGRTVSEADASLKRMFGGTYGISAERTPDSNQILCFTLRLPMQ